MKIVFITTLYPDSKDQSLTKVPYALHYFVQNWIKQGYQVEVIKIEAMYPKYLPQYIKVNKTRQERDVLIDDINVHVMQVRKNLNRHFSKASARKTSEKMLDYLSSKNTEYDAVVYHVHEPGFYIAVELKKKLNIPIIWGFHQSDINMINSCKNKKELEKEFNEVSAIAFRSNSLKTAFNKHFGDKIKSFTISSGIPKSIIKKQTVHKDCENLHFITVSNMIKRKNLDVLIKAFAKLHEENSKITLKILGDGAEMDNLKQLTAHLNMEASISFLGYSSRDVVFAELEKSNVFVLPSVRETFGMVYLEAMSQGCIPIGTIGEGIDGIIKDGVNGYLCRPDTQSCYDKMKAAINLSSEGIQDIKEKIHNTAQAYTEEKCAQQYAENIQETVNQEKA